jgi:hypothetical protein
VTMPPRSAAEGELPVLEFAPSDPRLQEMERTLQEAGTGAAFTLELPSASAVSGSLSDQKFVAA